MYCVTAFKKVQDGSVLQGLRLHHNIEWFTCPPPLNLTALKSDNNVLVSAAVKTKFNVTF